ncbi:hypothetical protein [Weissella bombi]|uniref:NADPH:quinone reductase n=1 Tax=Weissella bombi TaxID=1505725 RepID=A0A1C3YT94_9LACO|nr:hypothetical protein [Weissella bombi]SCB73327.1 NADPH:quinone reductase [Weissella bombi]
MVQAILQTGSTGLQSISTTNIEPDSFLPTSIEIKTSAVPILPFDVMKLEGLLPTKTPTIMGYGAVGQVIKIGSLRSSKLLHKRVLVMSPNGTFKDNIVSNFPPLTIPIPDNVSDQEAATVVGGLDTSLVLYKKISNHSAQNIIITGADSVIGLGLLQLLRDTEKRIFPLVRPTSNDYFKSRALEMQLPDYYNFDNTLSKENTLVIDIAGKFAIIQPYLEQNFPVMSVVLPNVNGVTFVSEPVFPKDYRRLLQKISEQELLTPIDQVFKLNEVKRAFNYQRNSASRGRNILLFK